VARRRYFPEEKSGRNSIGVAVEGRGPGKNSLGRRGGPGLFIRESLF